MTPAVDGLLVHFCELKDPLYLPSADRVNRHARRMVVACKMEIVRQWRMQPAHVSRQLSDNLFVCSPVCLSACPPPRRWRSIMWPSTFPAGQQKWGRGFVGFGETTARHRRLNGAANASLRFRLSPKRCNVRSSRLRNASVLLTNECALAAAFQLCVQFYKKRARFPVRAEPQQRVLETISWNVECRRLQKLKAAFSFCMKVKWCSNVFTVEIEAGCGINITETGLVFAHVVTAMTRHITSLAVTAKPFAVGWQVVYQPHVFVNKLQDREKINNSCCFRPAGFARLATDWCHLWVVESFVIVSKRLHQCSAVPMIVSLIGFIGFVCSTGTVDNISVDLSPLQRSKSLLNFYLMVF